MYDNATPMPSTLQRPPLFGNQYWSNEERRPRSTPMTMTTMRIIVWYNNVGKQSHSWIEEQYNNHHLCPHSFHECRMSTYNTQYIYANKGSKYYPQRWRHVGQQHVPINSIICAVHTSIPPERTVPHVSWYRVIADAISSVQKSNVAHCFAHRSPLLGHTSKHAVYVDETVQKRSLAGLSVVGSVVAV